MKRTIAGITSVCLFSVVVGGIGVAMGAPLHISIGMAIGTCVFIGSISLAIYVVNG